MIERIRIRLAELWQKMVEVLGGGGGGPKIRP